MNAGIAPAGPFLHEALFYRDQDEFLAGTVPFVHAGIAADEPVMVAVPPANGELLRRALDPGMLGRVSIMDMSGGDRVGIPAVLHAFVQHHPGRRVRLIGEPAWGDAGNPTCARHESLINVAFAGQPASILCPYDTNRLDPEVVADAARTHPILVDHDGRRDSADYTDPATVVGAFNEELAEPAELVVGPLEFHARQLSVVRRAVGEEALRQGLSVERVTDLRLAVNEVATNAVTHTAGPATLRMWRADGQLVCEVRDPGRLTGYLLGRLPPAMHDAAGRGLLLVHELCDHVRIHASDRGTTIRLYLNLRG
jgi:anti-sigma regulatory factor (Ser/Thr protein kinase)